MNFRTIAQMNDHIVAGLVKVPRDVDLIVGVPRSGMLPATILALNLNVALTDVNGLLEGKLLEAGIHRKNFQRITRVADARKILIIDDSYFTGNQMAAVRARVAGLNFSGSILYTAVYATPETCDQLDLYFDICPMPRMFEWNIMHHPGLQQACLDIDGVLCCDPTEQENDDGGNYLKFLDEAKPLWIPTVKVGCLVTSRLEKYRVPTENWLLRNNVKYGELVMLNMNTAEARRAANCHARFKAGVYRSKPADLFIESNSSQSAEIAELACKLVFCTADRRVYFPSNRAAAGFLVRDLPPRLPGIGWRIVNALRRRLLLF